MSSKQELQEEEKIFFVLRDGAHEPEGPYSESELVRLLNRRTISSSDLVYYPALPNWKPIKEVFEFHRGVSNLDDDGQDKEYVENCFNLVSAEKDPEEDIYYIAVQGADGSAPASAVLLSMPTSIVLTTEKLYVVRPSLIGDPEVEKISLDVVDHVEVILKRKAEDSLFSIRLRSGSSIEVNHIPLAQMRRLEDLANRFINCEV